MSLWNVYVGAFTKEFAEEVQKLNQTANIFWKGTYPRTTAIPSEGIERLLFDDATGDIRYLGNAAGDLVSPTYLALHPGRPVLYAAEWARAGRLTAFAIGRDGTLERQSSIDTLGEFAVAVGIHPSGKFAYVAHWGDGGVTACSLDDAGNPVTAELIDRSEARDGRESHLHEVRVSPGGNCLISTDLGLDQITTFELDAEGAVSPGSIARLEFPVHSSPRHVEFHPSGKTVYVNGEHDSMVHVLDAEDGLPTRIRSSHSSRPPGYDGVNSCSELDLHPDAHTLYVGNRGSDCVAVFAVDDGGDLAIAGHQAALGRSPRAVRLDPTGGYLLVGNRNTNGLVAFNVGEDPLLAPVGEPVEVPSPSSLAFVRVAEGGVA